MTLSRQQEPDDTGPLADSPVRRRGTQTVTVGEQSFVKVGLPAFSGLDFYRFAVSLNTRRFLLLFLGAELAINTLFALLYLAVPGAIANQTPAGFLGAFFFSLETLATVGYGEMFPGSLYGHVVAATEILVGVGFTALMTGVLFVRFSKPRPMIVYADRAVVTITNGRRTLMFRFGNARSQPLHGAEVRLYVLVRTVTAEGIRHAHPAELELLRSRLPVFALTWTLMHVIDGASPLADMDLAGAEVGRMRFFLSVEARDPTIGQEIADLHTFSGADLHLGMRYVDCVTAADGGPTVADFSLLSEIEPDPAAGREGSAAPAEAAGSGRRLF